MFYGNGDEIEDKEEALRLLWKAKALNLPAAYSGSANYYMDEVDNARPPSNDRPGARTLYQKALGLLKKAPKGGTVVVTFIVSSGIIVGRD